MPIVFRWRFKIIYPCIFQCPYLHRSAVSKEMSEKGIVDLVIAGFKGHLSIHDDDDGENATDRDSEPIIKSTNGSITINNNENGRI